MALGAATLTYNFMNPGTLPPGISLTRAGTATSFDSGGVLRTAPLNLWLQSADASNAAWTKGAGGGATAPVVTANQTTAPDGTMTAASAVFPAVSVAASWSNLNQNVPFATGSIVTFSMYLKGAVGGEQLYLAWNGGAAGTSSRFTLTTAWQRFSVTTPVINFTGLFFQIGTDLRIGTQAATAAQTVYLWGGQVEVGAAASAYVPTTSAVNGAPRWDYDPLTSILRGLLIEEPRTNLTFPSTNWRANATASGSVDGVTQNAGVAPDGTSAAMALIPGSFSGVHQYFPGGFAGVVSTTYTYSVFLKAAGMAFCYIELANSGFTGTTQNAQFNLASGTIDLQSGTSGTIQNVGGGWYRCSVTATSAASAGTYIANLRPGATGGAYIGATTGNAVDGVWAWGNHVEAGAKASSYIPTTSAAATRPVDIVGGNNDALYNAAQGTWQAEFIPNGLPTAVASVIHGNNGSPVLAANSDSRLICSIRATVTIFSGVGPLHNYGVVNRSAFAYLSGASLGALNGTVIGPAATAFSVTGTTLRFGADGASGANVLNGWLRQASYWNAAGAAADMAQITAPDTPAQTARVMILA